MKILKLESRCYTEQAFALTVFPLFLFVSLSLVQTSELSIKSCESDAPFPVHPGTSECCTKEGLERKLCMAALSHQPQEFPAYVEPTNDEICEAFRKDPKGFADQ